MTQSHPADPEAKPDRYSPFDDSMEYHQSVAGTPAPETDTPEAKPDATICQVCNMPVKIGELCPRCERPAPTHATGTDTPLALEDDGPAIDQSQRLTAPDTTTTPETDAFVKEHEQGLGVPNDWCYPISFARRLEKDRNALRGQVEELKANADHNYTAGLKQQEAFLRQFKIAEYLRQQLADKTTEAQNWHNAADGHAADYARVIDKLATANAALTSNPDGRVRTIIDLQRHVLQLSHQLEEARRERDAWSARAKLAEEGMATEQELMREVLRSLDEAGAPTNGVEGYGKRQSLSPVQRLAHLRAQLDAANAALEEARRERDDANKIKSAEKLILLKEIGDHAATKAQLDAAKKAAIMLDTIRAHHLSLVRNERAGGWIVQEDGQVVGNIGHGTTPQTALANVMEVLAARSASTEDQP